MASRAISLTGLTKVTPKVTSMNIIYHLLEYQGNRYSRTSHDWLISFLGAYVSKSGTFCYNKSITSSQLGDKLRESTTTISLYTLPPFTRVINFFLHNLLNLCTVSYPIITLLCQPCHWQLWHTTQFYNPKAEMFIWGERPCNAPILPNQLNQDRF